jgi:hypothetical protein
MSTPIRSPRPGPAKVRTPPILIRRRSEIVATQGGRLMELLDAASVMSEGATRDEEGESVYYGTTSLLFALRSSGGALPDEQSADLAFAIENDPHARLLVIRVAHREASARAGSSLGPLSAELHVKPTTRGVLVSIDVVARVRGGRVSGAHF